MDEMWNLKLTRENLKDFYDSTVEMAYPAVLGITKESTRCEAAVIKSYSEVYAKRNELAADQVVYEFGDILLRNANAEISQFPVRDDFDYVEKNLDEYTRNSMFEKITAKVDSRGFKMAEFISSDSKKKKRTKQIRKISDLFPITPLLVIEVLILALLIWLVSYAAITTPYKSTPLIDEQTMFESVSLQEQYIAVMSYYPLINVVTTTEEGEEASTDSSAAASAEPIETEATEISASLATTTTAETEYSATSG